MKKCYIGMKYENGESKEWRTVWITKWQYCGWQEVAMKLLYGK